LEFDRMFKSVTSGSTEEELRGICSCRFVWYILAFALLWNPLTRVPMTL
jgi:hypothetical protein